MLKKYLLIALVFGIAFSKLGAQGISRQEVLALFEDTTNIQWVRSYKGRVNDMEQAQMMLALNGFYAKGYVFYPKSGTSIELSGTLKGNKILLQELNQEGQITGYYSGIMNTDKMDLDWENYNHTIGSKYLLYTDHISTKQSNILSKKWVKWYNGTVTHENLRLILMHKQSDQLSGYCYNDSGTRMYTVSGNINPDKTIHLDFYLDQISIANFDGIIKGKNNIQGKVTGIGLVNEALKLSLENELELKENAYQNFRTSVEVLLPDSKDNDFDIYLADKIKDLLNNIETKIKSSNPLESDNPQPEDRLKWRAYIYPEIHFVTKDLICGTILYSTTWENSEKTIAFNFDNKHDKEILEKDLWNKDQNIQDSIKTYFSRQGKTDFEYKYFNITPKGIRYYSDLDPIYGRKEETVPFTEMKKWITRKSPIKSLVKYE